MKLITELKRRNVIRVGIAYVVAAWLLAQVADLVLDVMGAPDIVLRSVVAILALGFFPAVIFAWAFEMTPEGVKKQSEIDNNQSITQETAKKLDYVTIGLVIAVVVFVVVERYLPEPGNSPVVVQTEQAELDVATETTAKPEEADSIPDIKSIAVLPFANRSNQDDDLFFTDGIHDDLLTQLAKIRELTVTSRTSVMEYRNSSKNITDIGAELNVGTILEGGIQKVGDRVRINTQLIEVATDKHLWAETFDRELTAENIFDIQSEIARKIVQAVAIQLTPEEEKALSEIPTQNLAAYEAYLRAKESGFGANYSVEQERIEQNWLEKAIALDPEFAQAHAKLADVYGQVYWRGLDTSPTFIERYRHTVERALLLNPKSPSALQAQANFYYRVENDYETSLNLIEDAISLAPENAELYGDRGYTLRRLGRWEEAIASLRKSTEIDPSSRFNHATMLETMDSIQDWQGILDQTVPIEDADPNDLDIQVSRAVAIMHLTGDLDPLERVFEKMNLENSTSYSNWSANVHWYKRDFDKVIEVLNNPIWLADSTNQIFGDFREFALANAWRMKGDLEKANQLYSAITGRRNEIMNSVLQVKAYSGMTVALSLAYLEQFDEALELSRELMNDFPYQRDSMLHGWMLTQQAMIKGMAGDHEAAMDDLEIAFEITTAIRVHAWDLYYDPNWDFMRDNSRFIALSTPPTIIKTGSY
jgi:TolB-like protein